MPVVVNRFNASKGKFLDSLGCLQQTDCESRISMRESIINLLTVNLSGKFGVVVDFDAEKFTAEKTSSHRRNNDELMQNKAFICTYKFSAELFTAEKVWNYRI
jgi:hypothetical protein